MRYNYPRPTRPHSPPATTRVYHALSKERAYVSHLIRQRTLLLNTLECMSKFVKVLTGEKELS